MTDDETAGVPMNETGSGAAITDIIQVFDLVAGGYDHPALRYFPFCADYCVSRCELRPGEKVLDVACGTGVVATAAAQCVRPGGRVFAVDLSAAMLDRTEQNAKKMQLDNIDLHQMDGQRLEFRKDYFHATLCSFGLFFMPAMDEALRQWVRVTRPGGRILFTSFSETAFQPFLDCFFGQLQDYGIETAKNPALQQLSVAENCRAMLQQAGAEEVEVEQKQFGYHFDSAEDWWSVLWNAGLRGRLTGLEPGVLERFRQEHLAGIERYRTDKGFWLDVPVLITHGIKPCHSSTVTA